MKRKLLLNVFIGASLLLAVACNKSENDEKAVLQVMLTDAPAEYEEVLIDVQDVQIHVSADENDGAWQSLDVNSGVYNLLDFRNGMDTLLASLELPAGHISQMRLVLGDNNQVRTPEGLFDLVTPSAQQSGLKFNIDADLQGGMTYRLWIDFDAARSIVLKGNGEYSLKPVIRTYTEAVSGAITGTVSPAQALPSILAVADGDTISTLAAEDGNFMIKGVPAGLWTVYFNPVTPYIPDTVSGVTVENGVLTEMDTVYFAQ